MFLLYIFYRYTYVIIINTWLMESFLLVNALAIHELQCTFFYQEMFLKLPINNVY